METLDIIIVVVLSILAIPAVWMPLVFLTSKMWYKGKEEATVEGIRKSLKYLNQKEEKVV